MMKLWKRNDTRQYSWEVMADDGMNKFKAHNLKFCITCIFLWMTLYGCTSTD